MLQLLSHVSELRPWLALCFKEENDLMKHGLCWFTLVWMGSDRFSSQLCVTKAALCSYIARQAGIRFCGLDTDFIQHRDLHKMANGSCCSHTKVNNHVRGKKGGSVQSENASQDFGNGEMRLRKCQHRWTKEPYAAGSEHEPQPALQRGATCTASLSTGHGMGGDREPQREQKKRCFIWMLRQKASAYLSAFEF